MNFRSIVMNLDPLTLVYALFACSYLVVGLICFSLGRRWQRRDVAAEEAAVVQLARLADKDAGKDASVALKWPETTLVVPAVSRPVQPPTTPFAPSAQPFVPPTVQRVMPPVPVSYRAKHLKTSDEPGVVYRAPGERTHYLKAVPPRVGGKTP